MRALVTSCLAVGLVLQVTASTRGADPKTMGDTPSEAIPKLNGATVSVPWSELRSFFGRGLGVAEAPVRFVWVDAKYAVDATSHTASVTVTASIRVLSDGWAAVSLGPAGSSLVGVTAAGKACPVFAREGQLYALLSGKGEHKLTITLETVARRIAGGSQLAVPLVPAPIIAFVATLPAKDLETKVDGAVGLQITQAAKHTMFRCSLRGGRIATVNWKPRSKEKRDPIVSARVDTLVALHQSRLRYRTMVEYEILRAGVSEFELLLPKNAVLRSITGRDIIDKRTEKTDKGTRIELQLLAAVQGTYRIELDYLTRLTKKQNEVPVAVVTPLKVEEWTGHVAVQGAVNADIRAKPTELERIDVTELPMELRRTADRAVVLAYRVSAPEPDLTLALERHQDVRVLVAMCDVCEAGTVYTPDGQAITKLMFITRNNAKPFMTLELPEDAQVWSALVDDRPVSPARNAKGQLLVPLTKSEEVEQHDEQSYQHRREQRRQSQFKEVLNAVQEIRQDSERPRDLKPFDVEIVYVQPGKKAEASGQLAFQLPKCDIPVGRMAWAVFLPDAVRVVDVEGNLKEVRNFSLPFVHFGEEAYRRQRVSQALERAEQLKEAMKAAEQEKSLAELAERATAEGVLPVRVELPIAGELYRFEKLLLVNESPQVKLTYRHRSQ